MMYMYNQLKGGVTMKILKKGKPRSWEIEQVCTGRCWSEVGVSRFYKGCGARLLVSEADIITPCVWDCYFQFKCPCCGCINSISANDIDDEVKERLIEKYEKKK